MRHFAWAFLIFLAAPASAEPCIAPEPVCATREAVFPVVAFDPFASAVRIEPDLLVTNRHVVADEETAELVLPDGSTITAYVVPTAYGADLVLLRAAGLPPGPVLEPSRADGADTVFTVGADLETGRVRAYQSGTIIALPPAHLDTARVHSSAHSQPGNSGGALVNADGDLVAIIASGGEGRNEAIPVRKIAELIEMSGPEHRAESDRIGAAYRACTEALEAAFGRRIGASDANQLQEDCTATANRQMQDLAAQALGQSGHHGAAIDLLLQSLAEDPNALNARVSLVVTYHLAGRYREALPHLERLLESAPGDSGILRLVLRTGMAAGEDAIVRRARELLAEKLQEATPERTD